MLKSKKDLLMDLLAIVGGTAAAAAGMVMFTIPGALAPGGVSGLATVLAMLVPLSLGTLTLLINLPIFVVGWRIFGWKSLALTLLATVCFSVFLDVLALFLPAYTGSRMLASVFGGVMMGGGLGLLFTRGVTSGGTDLLAMILRKPFPQFRPGALLMLIDVLVVLFAMLMAQDVEVGLYSIIAIYLQGKVIDAMMEGMDHAKVIMIVTDKAEPIRAVLVDERERGVTEFIAKGGYTREHKTMLLTVARRSEIADTLRIVKSLDPAAFIILHDAAEVRGEGFKDL